MKVLLDCIWTAAPRRCSTGYQFVTFMNRTLAARDDVFFYCLLPDWEMEKEDWDYLPSDPRVKYIRVPQHKDRTKEYVTLRNEVDNVVAFNGNYWDFDVLLTVRTGLVPLYKMLMMSPKQGGLRYLKEIWVIEEMPLMQFKTSVMKLESEIQDRFTLMGYLAADRVATISYHEKAEIRNAARQYLAPSLVRDIDAKIKETIPASKGGDPVLKDPKFFYWPNSGQRFTLAYAGRLMSTSTHLDTIYEAMTKSWIMRKGDNVRMVVCTNSVGGVPKAQPKAHMEKFLAPRDEFWRMAREEMHLLMIMHDDGGYSLSMMEPLMLGTPVIVCDQPWSRALLGPSYPFYAKGEFELYAWAKCFYEDYANQYAKFENWIETWFKPTYAQRFANDLLYDVLDKWLAAYDSTALAKFVSDSPGRVNNDIVNKILGAGPPPAEIKLFDRLKELAEDGELRSLDQRLDGDDRDSRWLAYATPWNHFRNVLMAFHGYTDASVEVGHLRLKTKPIAAKKGKKK